jgi:P4 family phage/plasmid primase-like protien
MQIVKSIMPIKEDMEYLLKTISLGLLNDNPVEEFYIWQGIGGNGKGVLSSMLYETLGKYCGTLDINYLAKTKDGQHANAADPQLASLRYSRLVISTEPEHDINIRSAKLKQLAGRDTVKTRLLYGNAFEFIPKFNMIIQTNYAPKIDGTDGGITRRLRKIHFDMQFVPFPDPKNKYQVKGDPELKNKIKDIKYKHAFFKILTQYYKLYLKEGLNMTERVKHNTSEYLEDNDPVSDFIKIGIAKTDNKKDKVSSSNMFDAFKEYTKERSEGWTQAKFKTTLEKNGFELKREKVGCMWQKCKLIDNEE